MIRFISLDTSASNGTGEREMDKTDIPGTFNAGATLGPVQPMRYSKLSHGLNETNMARIWNKHKQTNTPLKRKVFVGLSGGVDSSVSAALLKKSGYEVTGVFIKVWNENAELTRKEERRTDAEEKAWKEFARSGCTMADDRLDAMRVCAKLKIPFIELNLEKAYKREVVDYMIREYKAGRTPNPDVMCNRFIKFGMFYKWAMKNEADFVATGHYARVGTREYRISNIEYRNKSKIPDSKLNAKRLTLNAGLDSAKDQSYFLWQIRKKQLPYILFPVGGMRKTEVRKLARKFGLVTSEKKDSQGLCFIGKINMKEFLSHYMTPKGGKVIDEQGKVIGEHDGAIFYTLGERISFATTASSGGVFKGGWYVIAKNMERNTLTVSQKSPEGNLGGAVMEASIKNCNWLIQPKKQQRYLARIRYRQPLQACVLAAHGTRVRFMSPQTVAPGQSLVLYKGDRVVGGGIMR